MAFFLVFFFFFCFLFFLVFFFLLFFCFVFFFQNIGFDISCKMPPEETVCMKC